MKRYLALCRVVPDCGGLLLANCFCHKELVPSKAAGGKNQIQPKGDG